MIALVLNQFSSCHVLSRISTVVDLVRTFSCVITLESPCRVEELRPLTFGFALSVRCTADLLLCV